MSLIRPFRLCSTSMPLALCLLAPLSLAQQPSSSTSDDEPAQKQSSTQDDSSTQNDTKSQDKATPSASGQAPAAGEDEPLDTAAQARSSARQRVAERLAVLVSEDSVGIVRVEKVGKEADRRLEVGDRILEVSGKAVVNVNDVAAAINAVSDKSLRVKLARDEKEGEVTLQLLSDVDISDLEPKKNQTIDLGGMVLMPFDKGPAIVAQVAPNSPAWESGYREGDRIISINGIAPDSFDQLHKTIETSLADRSVQSLPVQVQRDKEALQLTLKLADRSTPPAVLQQLANERMENQQRATGNPNQVVPGAAAGNGAYPVYGGGGSPYGGLGYGGLGYGGEAGSGMGGVAAGVVYLQTLNSVNGATGGSSFDSTTVPAAIQEYQDNFARPGVGNAAAAQGGRAIPGRPLTTNPQQQLDAGVGGNNAADQQAIIEGYKDNFARGAAATPGAAQGGRAIPGQTPQGQANAGGQANQQAIIEGYKDNFAQGAAANRAAAQGGRAIPGQTPQAQANAGGEANQQAIIEGYKDNFAQGAAANPAAAQGRVVPGGGPQIIGGNPATTVPQQQQYTNGSNTGGSLQAGGVAYLSQGQGGLQVSVELGSDLQGAGRTVPANRLGNNNTPQYMAAIAYHGDLQMLSSSSGNNLGNANPQSQLEYGYNPDNNRNPNGTNPREGVPTSGSGIQQGSAVAEADIEQRLPGDQSGLLQGQDDASGNNTNMPNQAAGNGQYLVTIPLQADGSGKLIGQAPNVSLMQVIGRAFVILHADQNATQAGGAYPQSNDPRNAPGNNMTNANGSMTNVNATPVAGGIVGVAGRGAAMGNTGANNPVGNNPAVNPAVNNPAGNNPVGNNPVGNNPSGVNPPAGAPAASGGANPNLPGVNTPTGPAGGSPRR